MLLPLAVVYIYFHTFTLRSRFERFDAKLRQDGVPC